MSTRLGRMSAAAAVCIAFAAVPGAAFASGGSGSGGGAGGSGSGGTKPACAGLTLDPPEMIGGVLRWTGAATNCSSGAERIVLKASDVSGASIPGCTLAPFTYGLPSQSAGQSVPWFMTSPYEPCAGTHTEQIDAYAGSSSIPAVSQRITFTTP